MILEDIFQFLYKTHLKNKKGSSERAFFLSGWQLYNLCNLIISNAIKQTPQTLYL